MAHPSSTSNGSSKRLSGMFPWRRSVAPPPSSRKSVYGSTSGFHNPGHFPVISEPVLKFSTADFIASSDFRSVPDSPSRPVPAIHQYKPSQHAINTRNSIIHPATRGSNSTHYANNNINSSTRISSQSPLSPALSSSSSMGIPSPHLDRRVSSANSAMFAVSANTTCPIPAPNDSKDPTHAAVAASTMATASAAFNTSPNNAVNRRLSIASSASRPGSMYINTHTHINPMTPVSPMVSSASSFPPVKDPSASPLIGSSSLENESEPDLKSKIQDSEQRAIDILIEYQQKLDKARKKIIDLEKKLQEESKAKRQLSAQAAQATAAAVVAKSSIRNPPSLSTPPSIITHDSNLTPASFLSSNNVLMPTSSSSPSLNSDNPEATPVITYTNQNITPEAVLAKMSNADLQTRVTSLETQRETLRNALKSLRTARDLEIKQYQDQIARLKKQGAYQEFINQRQSAMLYNSPSPTASDASHQTLGQSPVYPTYPTPLKVSTSYGSLPLPTTTTSSQTCLPSPKLQFPTNPLGMSLPNGSNSSFKTESRLRIRRTGTAISPIFPTANFYPVSAGPNSPIVMNARPRNKHQRSRSLFSTTLGLPCQGPAASNKEFRNLSLHPPLKGEKNSTYNSSRLSATSICNDEDDGDSNDITSLVSQNDFENPNLPQDSESIPNQTTSDYHTDESNIENRISNPFPGSSSSSITDSPDLSTYTFDSTPDSDLGTAIDQNTSHAVNPSNDSKQVSATRKGSVSSIASTASKSSVRGLIKRYSILPRKASQSAASSANHSPQSSCSNNGLVDLVSGSNARAKSSRPMSVIHNDNGFGGASSTPTHHTHFPNSNPASAVYSDPLTSMNNVNVRASISDYSASIHTAPAQGGTPSFKRGTHVLSGSENSINSQHSTMSAASTNLSSTTTVTTATSTTDSECLTDGEMDNHTASTTTSIDSVKEDFALDPIHKFKYSTHVDSNMGQPAKFYQRVKEMS